MRRICKRSTAHPLALDIADLPPAGRGMLPRPKRFSLIKFSLLAQASQKR